MRRTCEKRSGLKSLLYLRARGYLVLVACRRVYKKWLVREELTIAAKGKSERHAVLVGSIVGVDLSPHNHGSLTVRATSMATSQRHKQHHSHQRHRPHQRRPHRHPHPYRPSTHTDTACTEPPAHTHRRTPDGRRAPIAGTDHHTSRESGARPGKTPCSGTCTGRYSKITTMPLSINSSTARRHQPKSYWRGPTTKQIKNRTTRIQTWIWVKAMSPSGRPIRSVGWRTRSPEGTESRRAFWSPRSTFTSGVARKSASKGYAIPLGAAEPGESDGSMALAKITGTLLYVRGTGTGRGSILHLGRSVRAQELHNRKG